MKESEKLYGYHVWANKLVFNNLRTLPEEAWGQEMVSVFPSIQAMMSHVLAIDAMWLRVIMGDSFVEARAVREHVLSEVSSYTLERMEQIYEHVADDYRAMMKETDTEEKITITHPTSGTMTVTIANLIQHVVNHGTQHRGNLSAMLRQIGHKNAPTDYAFYLYSLE